MVALIDNCVGKLLEQKCTAKIIYTAQATIQARFDTKCTFILQSFNPTFVRI